MGMSSSGLESSGGGDGGGTPTSFAIVIGRTGDVYRMLMIKLTTYCTRTCRVNYDTYLELPSISI